MRQDRDLEKFLEDAPWMRKWVHQCAVCHQQGYTGLYTSSKESGKMPLTLRVGNTNHPSRLRSGKGVHRDERRLVFPYCLSFCRSRVFWCGLEGSQGTSQGCLCGWGGLAGVGSLAHDRLVGA